MRIGLVVDSACDLPPDFIHEHHIAVLPITIRVGDEEFVDQRDPEATLAFYRKHLANEGRGESVPYSVEQIKRVFLDRLVIDYDFVFCLTVASSRSPIFENAQRASFAILSEYKPIRARAGVAGPFALRVVDTQNLFCAQAISAVETARMIREGATPNRIRERLDALIPQVYGYMLPNDLYHLRARAHKKGDKSVGWFKYAVGSALDIKPVVRGWRNDTEAVANVRHFEDGAERCFRFVTRRIEEGLLTPTLAISYAGELRRLEELPGYTEMTAAATDAGISIYLSVMSMTGGINVGEGALAFAFAAPEHEVKL